MPIDALVESSVDITDNVRVLEHLKQGGVREHEFFKRTIANGRVFVALTDTKSYKFAPSKFAGYRQNNINHANRRGQRHGGTTNDRINKILGDFVGPDHRKYQVIEKAFRKYCAMHDIQPSKHAMHRRYWIVDVKLPIKEIVTPSSDETSSDEEGHRVKVWVNRYERNPRARQKCVNAHGFDCAICSFNFERSYGSLGAGFIHVHHLKPLSKIGNRYKVDGEKDLLPVCPNCHAMLHVGKKPLTVQELRKLVRNGVGK